jgi:hypothetical protein
MKERKWGVARIIGRGEVVYYSAHQTQYNLEHIGAGGIWAVVFLSIALPL